MVPNGYNLAYGSSVVQRVTPEMVKSIILELKKF